MTTTPVSENLVFESSTQLQMFKDNVTLSSYLANAIGEILARSVALTGGASLILPGGSTPIPLFSKLSTLDLPWEKIKVSSCDERVLPMGDISRCDATIEKHLLIGKAKKARFYTLLEDEIKTGSLDLAQADGNFPENADVLVLGMGVSGHIASVFPDAIEKERIFYGEDSVYEVNSKLAGTKRVTMSLSRLRKAKNVFIHITGMEKLGLIAEAKKNDDIEEMPVRAFISKGEFVKILWALQ